MSSSNIPQTLRQGSYDIGVPLRSYSEAPRPLTPDEVKRREKLCFSYTRLRAVNAILAYDNGGPCRTDDGVVYFDLMLPYAVEASELGTVSTFDGAFRRFSYWMPNLLGGLGRTGFADQWDEMSNLRSLAEGRHRIRSKTGNIDWLPTEDRIVAETRLTREKRAAINALYPGKPPLRGIGVIDPLSEAEKKEANKLRMREKRLSDGVIPQAERNQRAEDIALAKLADCTDRTIRTKRLAGTLESYLAKRGVIFPKVCTPYIETEGPAQIWENALTDPQAEGMATLADILDDPGAWNEMPEFADPYNSYLEHASFV